MLKRFREWRQRRHEGSVATVKQAFVETLREHGYGREADEADHFLATKPRCEFSDFFMLLEIVGIHGREKENRLSDAMIERYVDLGHRRQAIDPERLVKEHELEMHHREPRHLPRSWSMLRDFSNAGLWEWLFPLTGVWPEYVVAHLRRHGYTEEAERAASLLAPGGEFIVGNNRFDMRNDGARLLVRLRIDPRELRTLEDRGITVQELRAGQA